jgi:hypothetical protein
MRWKLSEITMVCPTTLLRDSDWGNEQQDCIKQRADWWKNHCYATPAPVSPFLSYSCRDGCVGPEWERMSSTRCPMIFRLVMRDRSQGFASPD